MFKDNPNHCNFHDSNSRRSWCTEHCHEVKVGNIYKKGGGLKSKNSYWVVVGIDGSQIYMLSVYKSGKINGCVAMGEHYICRKEVIGFCKTPVGVKFKLEIFEDE